MEAKRAQPSSRMTVDEFLAWAPDQPGRHELVEGEVFAMSPERALHAEAKAATYMALRDALRRAAVPCRAMPDGMTVRVSSHTSYEPDALVYCGPRLPADAIEVLDAVIVVEVLSPGTKSVDTGAKFTGYFSLASLQHYLVVNPERRIVTHHQRGEGGLIASRIAADGSLRLDPPGLDLPVADLFPEP